MAIAREEFEAQYNGGNIIPLLLEGRLSIECRCDWEECTGWKMSHVDYLSDDVKLHVNTFDEVRAALDHRLELVSKFKLDPDGKKI